MPRPPPTTRLALARAGAWALLIAGWVGIGSLAVAATPSPAQAFAVVALWLLAIGGAARVATAGPLHPGLQAGALLAAAALTAGALASGDQGPRGPALLLALAGWAALTALASGVVRSLRLGMAARPAPPVGAAAAGALAAGLVLGDIADAQALAQRLATFVLGMALLLALLPWGLPCGTRAPGCRAGLFDCSLPAWPQGAWRSLPQWPLLLSGLVMLPMMAALPLMALWCRELPLSGAAMLLLHLAAMFVPVLLLQRRIATWPLPRLAALCTAALVLGAAALWWAPRPWDLLGLAVAHGAAWGLAWGGQLWAPSRRGEQGSSPLRAAAGYALLTLGFGLAVERWGAAGLAAVHGGLTLAAVVALVVAWAMAARRAARPGPARPPASPPPTARPGHR